MLQVYCQLEEPSPDPICPPPPQVMSHESWCPPLPPWYSLSYPPPLRIMNHETCCPPPPPPLQVSFLLEVYGELEEPDGLSGLIQLRQGGLTHADQILAAEKAGSWSEALTLYEMALEREGGGAGTALAARYVRGWVGGWVQVWALVARCVCGGGWGVGGSCVCVCVCVSWGFGDQVYMERRTVWSWSARQ